MVLGNLSSQCLDVKSLSLVISTLIRISGLFSLKFCHVDVLVSKTDFHEKISGSVVSDQITYNKKFNVISIP